VRAVTLLHLYIASLSPASPPPPLVRLPSSLDPTFPLPAVVGSLYVAGSVSGDRVAVKIRRSGPLKLDDDADAIRIPHRIGRIIACSSAT